MEGPRKTATETGLNRAVQIQRKPAWNLIFSKSCESFYPFAQPHPASFSNSHYDSIAVIPAWMPES
ncbi:MAG: hypothetical protein ACOYMG_27990, partial [Candidatus Methylumidiphilus sp.]